MTDTKEMRDAFETIAPDFKINIERTSEAARKRGIDSYKYENTEYMFKFFQAAWTRKPAEQVAGEWKDRLYAAMDEEFALRNSDQRDSDGQRVGMRGDDTQIGVEFAMKWFENMLAETITYPAPEPVSVPVSAPVPWRERVGHYDIKYMTNKAKVAIEAEIADWRALAAERGWVK